MGSTTLEELEREVAATPRDAGPRLRLGTALLEAGDVNAAASHLQLAARLEPRNPHVGLIALGAMVRAGRARDAALLLSAHLRPQPRDTLVAPEQLEVLLGMLAHPEPFVRCHTARGLGRLRVVQCVDALERTCRDEDGAVRLAAMTSLRQLKAH